MWGHIGRGVVALFTGVGLWKVLEAFFSGLHWTPWEIPLAACIVLAWVAFQLAWLVWKSRRDRWVEDLGNAVDDRARRWITGRDRKQVRAYRRHLAAVSRGIDRMGVLELNHSPRLQDVFVETSVSRLTAPEIPNSVIGNQLDANDTARRRSVRRVLASSRQSLVVVLGQPGSGKSTLLHNLVHESNSRRHWRRRIPVLLWLKECSHLITSAPRPTGQAGEVPSITLPEVIAKDLTARWPDGPGADWIGHRLRAGRCLVMIDGLDQVPDPAAREIVARWLSRQVTNYSRNKFLVTSRPPAYQGNRLPGASTVRARDFTSAQAREFAGKWYRSMARLDGRRLSRHEAGRKADDLLQRVERAPQLRRMPVNPMLLTLILKWEGLGHTGGLPESRYKLYHDICRALLQDSAPDMEGLLFDFASRLMEAGVQVVKRDEAIAIIATGAGQGQDSPAVLRAMVETGLLENDDRGCYHFVHRTFQEYLAAASAARDSQGGWITGHVGSTWWREALLMYASAVGPDDVIQACLADGSFAALDLAGECAAASRGLDPAIRQQLDDRWTVNLAAASALREKLELPNGTQVCAVPVDQALFDLYRDHRAGRAISPVPLAGKPATGVAGGAAADFVTWLNDLLVEGDTRYRLPTRSEVADRQFFADPSFRPYQVWTAPERAGQGPGLAAVPGRLSSYAVTAGELHERVRTADIGHVSAHLATLLAIGTAHALAVAAAALRASGKRRAGRLAARMAAAVPQFRAFGLGLLAQDGGGALGRSVEERLARACADAWPAMSPGSLVADPALPAEAALKRIIPLAVSRAHELDRLLRSLLEHLPASERDVPAYMPPRPQRSRREADEQFGRRLDAILDEIIGPDVLDIDLPLCILYARDSDLGKPRRATDWIWGPSLREVTDRWIRSGSGMVLPDTLRQLASAGPARVASLPAEPPDEYVRRRMMAVATRVAGHAAELVATTDEDREATPWQWSSARLGALVIAASALGYYKDADLAQCYMDVAAGVTALERRQEAPEALGEVIALVCEPRPGPEPSGRYW